MEGIGSVEQATEIGVGVTKGLGGKRMKMEKANVSSVAKSVATQRGYSAWLSVTVDESCQNVVESR